MSVAQSLAASLTNSTRSHGERFFQLGRVRVKATTVVEDTWVVDAVVLDSRPRHVALALEGAVLRVACTCPYVFQQPRPCKHVWATLLHAESTGLFERAATTLTMQIDHDRFGSEDDLGSFSESELVEVEPSASDDDAAPARVRRRTTTKAGEGQLQYRVNVGQTVESGRLVLELFRRARKRQGSRDDLHLDPVGRHDLGSVTDRADQRIVEVLDAIHDTPLFYIATGHGYSPNRWQLSVPTAEVLLPLLCRTGRCYLRLPDDADAPEPLEWSAQPAWELGLEVQPDGEAREGYSIAGTLYRGAERVPLGQANLVIGGLVVAGGRVARLDDFGLFSWVDGLRRSGRVTVSRAKGEELVALLLTQPRRPRLELPDELRYEIASVPPQPCLHVTKSPYNEALLHGSPSFDYHGERVAAYSGSARIICRRERQVILRDTEAERRAFERLPALGLKRETRGRGIAFRIPPQGLQPLVAALLGEGWFVDAEGIRYRRSSHSSFSVTSGIDWFELRGEARFGDQTATLPEVLAALRRHEPTVRLGDGSYGVLPEEWLRRLAPFAALGRPQSDHVRFSRGQVGLLDALLAQQPEVDVDAAFARARAKLAAFDGVKPARAPRGFTGELREYQREGLGWMQFLQGFGFGGCLADDMGLGKTIQVLALLQSRRGRGRKGSRRPSLVVVPRSLVFNWSEEARRFTPGLHVLVHTGNGRECDAERFAAHDVVLTTYGTLRRDALALKEIPFDYVILDEAQTIKNPSTQASVAARLLQADHRLALSGTPVENHIGELWSLFEFINPGILGKASRFASLLEGRGDGDVGARTLLAAALRPFILRRTKAQVAPELPRKIEQTVFCDLPPRQRKQYDELRDHYRRMLEPADQREGLGRSKLEVLEALLRLRQVACHPGLLDAARVHEPSAKLDLLLPQIEEVSEGGHKALVFSQFTSLLAIVRDRLDRDGVPYCYLDGKTRNRQAQVERFQNDPDCRVFLISLKAGGLGLNLTAAEYVFLLDPWWNPAVESQAIDRTHRIGQSRQVFAYRLVARDTVEEKILELQSAKRELADAIIQADRSLISKLNREDLELLLS